MRFSPGACLGPYQIVSPLGAGSMGEVYRAVDTRTGVAVAVNILADTFVRDRRVASRFEHEARAVVMMTHPNIRAILEFDVDAECPFVVTELLEGKTLREAMGAPIPWKKAVQIGAAIADGLAAAHARGIVHRDLKPESVFLASDGGVKILDFGVSHMRSAVEDESATDGYSLAELLAPPPPAEIGYASPEQIREMEAAETSDIYALGVMLYEMLSGKNPFAQGSSFQTRAVILLDEAPPLRQIVPGIPPRLERVVTRCLDKEQDERFQSSSELAEELREMVRDTEMGDLRGRRIRIAAVVAAAIAVVVLGAVLLLRGSGGLFSGGARTSVAVAPLRNAGGPDLEHLAGGLTEALVGQLAEISALRVAPRPGVSAAASGSESAPGAIVGGTVDVKGERVRVDIDLTDAETGDAIWTRSFERPRDEIAMLPGEIAPAIAKKLGVRLTREERESVARAATASAEAFELYMRGRTALRAESRRGREAAILHLTEAVAIDPGFARAHAALGEAYVLHSADAEPKRMRAKAREPIVRALQLDPRLAEGHFTLGLLRYFDWDFDSAEAELRRAIELNPNLASARAFRASLLLYRGWPEAAIEEARRAHAIDPTSVRAGVILVEALLHGGRIGEASDAASTLVRVAPGAAQSHATLAHVLAARGDEAAACGELVRSRELEEMPAGDIAALRAACAEGGLQAYRRALIPILQRGEPDVHAYEIAAAYAAVGDDESAYNYLETAWHERSSGILAMGIEPAFARMRDDPSVRSMLRRAGLVVTGGREGTRTGQAQAISGAAGAVQPAP